MALTEQTEHTVEVTANDVVQVRTERVILDNGVEISRSFHRHAVVPGQDASGEIGKVRRVVAATHVSTVIDKFQRQRDRVAAEDVRDTAQRAKAKNNTAANRAAEAKAKQDFSTAQSAETAADAAHKAFLSAEG